MVAHLTIFQKNLASFFSTDQFMKRAKNRGVNLEYSPALEWNKRTDIQNVIVAAHTSETSQINAQVVNQHANYFGPLCSQLVFVKGFASAKHDRKSWVNLVFMSHSFYWNLLSRPCMSLFTSLTNAQTHEQLSCNCRQKSRTIFYNRGECACHGSQYKSPRDGGGFFFL